MSSLERVVERLVQVRTVECPYCGLRVTVKNPRWKRVTCRGCGHKINVGFAKQRVEEVVERMIIHDENVVRRWKAMPLQFREIEARK